MVLYITVIVGAIAAAGLLLGYCICRIAGDYDQELEQQLASTTDNPIREEGGHEDEIAEPAGRATTVPTETTPAARLF